MTFKANATYALIDPEYYDNEEGEGYAFVETYGECDGMFITDCWVVNAEGEIHPGYAETCIPVRFDNVKPEAVGPARNADRKRSGLMWA